MTQPNPYDPPADSTQRESRLNKASFIGFMLTLVVPSALAISLFTTLASIDASPQIALRWGLIISSPAAIFAVVLGIVGIQGRPTRYSMLALLVGGAECIGVVLALLLTVL